MRIRLHIPLLLLLLFAAGARLGAQSLPGGRPFVSDFEEGLFQGLATGDEIDPGAFLLATDPNIDGLKLEAIRLKLHEQAQALAQHSPPVDAVFRGLRAEWLRDYEAKADLSDVFGNRQFNCVGGTALLALAFEGLGMDIELREQAKHVYLFVNDGPLRYRIETTSGDFGAIREANTARRSKPGSETAITLHQLAGLQYYNTGLSALDAGNPVSAVNQFRKAAWLYPCTRVAEMQAVAAAECKATGISALQARSWAEALSLLEHAGLPDHQDAALAEALTAAILHKAETAATLEAAHGILEAYGAWNPDLFLQAAFGASFGESCLLLAQTRFREERDHDAQSLLLKFEQLHMRKRMDVEPAMAVAVYRTAFLHALRIQDNGRAQACLEMGLSFAPTDASLLSGKMALAD